MKRAMERNGGFTLVELLVAMALGLLMTAVIVTAFSQSSRTSTVNQAVNEIQEQSRIALDMLQRDLRQAGYLGCNSNRLLGTGGIPNNMTNPPTSYTNNIEVYLQGYEGTGAAFTPAAPPQVTGANPNASPVSDAITVRIPVGEPVSLNATMAAGTDPIPVFSTAGFVPNSTLAAISNCDRAGIFIVTGLAGGLEHDAGVFNTIGDLGWGFGPDATVVPFQTISYYVAPSANNTENSLWRRVNQAANSEEVAEGVEDFQIQYGQDTDTDNFADIFTPADAVADWQRVVSIRVSLLLRSKSDRTAQATQNYNYNGATAIVPPDRRLRRPSNVTIQLRNKTI